jgi:predicted DNA-binding transcriptional regulator AlpA
MTTMTMPNTPSQRTYTIERLMEWTGLSRRQILARVRQGLFPAPLDLGRRTLLWSAKVVDSFLDGEVSLEAQ